MERHARHLACLCAAVVAGCASDDDPDVCEQYAAGFALTQPTGLTELIEEVRVTWAPPTADVDPIVTVRLLDALHVYNSRTALASEGGTTLTRFSFPSLGPPDPGIYRVETELGLCGGGAVIDGAPDLRVFVQGVTFPVVDFELTAADVPTTIMFRSVSLSTMQIEWLADVIGDSDERHAVATSSVPGELFVADRTIDFTGRDLDGDPLAAGDYAIIARISPATGSSYEIIGPTIYWSGI